MQFAVGHFTTNDIVMVGMLMMFVTIIVWISCRYSK